MVAADPVQALLAPGRSLRAAGPRVRSALSEEDAGAPYDVRARVYDRIIPARPYNRLLWGTEPGQYSAFAREALASAGGPFLEAGGGTAVFTAAAYRASGRPVVLVDRSLAMLGRAAARLGPRPGLELVQADLFDLPFAPARFATVASMGVLHVLEDVEGAVAALRAQVAPGGALFLSSLVAETRVGGAYLGALSRAGEVAAPRTTDGLTRLIAAGAGVAPTVRTSGSWLYATVRAG